jgi:hypothetical protein
MMSEQDARVHVITVDLAAVQLLKEIAGRLSQNIAL